MLRKINRSSIRLKSQDTPPDGASSLNSRPSVVPGHIFDTNINFLYQLEKDFRKTFKKTWKFPTDEIMQENQIKLDKRMLFYLDFLIKVGFRKSGKIGTSPVGRPSRW